MKKQINTTEAIFPMPVLLISTHVVQADWFGIVGNAFKDGFKLK